MGHTCFASRVAAFFAVLIGPLPAGAAAQNPPRAAEERPDLQAVWRHDIVPPLEHPIDPSGTRGQAQDIPSLHRGLTEIAVNGTLYIPHSSASDTTATVTGALGRYISAHDVVGVDTTLFVYSRTTDLYVSGFYHHLLGTRNPKLFVSIGAASGVNALSFRTYRRTYSSFLGRGDAGVRYFFTSRVALDITYNLLYLRNPGGGFAETTSSVVTLGLAHVF